MGKKCTKIDLTGQTYGRWLVLEYAGRDKSRRDLWRCKCTCRLGTERVVRGSALRNEKSQSCGCLNRECLIECNTKHGMSRSRLYRVWGSMLRRAGIHKGADKPTKRDYIDRGITVCDEWLVFENFRDWAVSHGYSDNLEIDRIDNNRGYSPENCRWVSRRENANNRRCTLRLDDGTSLAMFCSEVGIKTYENGRDTKQYQRISRMYRRDKIHPELLAIANEYLNTLRRLRASLDLLADIRKFRENCNASQTEVETCPKFSGLPIRVSI